MKKIISKILEIQKNGFTKARVFITRKFKHKPLFIEYRKKDKKIIIEITKDFNVISGYYSDFCGGVQFGKNKTFLDFIKN